MSEKSSIARYMMLVAWHSGGTLVFGQQTFPVLCLTCSQWVTNYVGKPSATSQPIRPTQPFILTGVNKTSSKLQSNVCHHLSLGGDVWWMLMGRGKGLVWLVGVVACLLAALWVKLSLSVGSGWPQFVLQHHYLLPIGCHFRDCKAR